MVVTVPYFPPHGGGSEKYAYEVARRLHEDYKWRVVVITSGERYGKDTKEEMDGLTVYRLGYGLKFSNTPFSFGWFGKIRKILKAERPDVINIHMPVPGIGDVTSFLAGKTPIVLSYHALSMRKGKSFPDILIWLYEHWPLRKLLNRAERIICSSPSVRTSFLKDYLYKSSVITTAVDTDLFKPDPSKKAKHPTVVFVAGLGRSEQHKGLRTLIDALVIVRKTIPDAHLTIVGEGDMRKEYEEYIKQIGLQDVVSFRGRLAGKALAEAYQEAHLFALPTTNDNSPTVILEAMACELPVVSTGIGNIPALVTNGKTGFLVDPTPQTFAEKISELLKDPQRSSSFGKNARPKIVNEFSWHQRVIAHENLFEEVLAPHKPTIVQVVPYYPPHIGGIEIVAEEISQELIKRGYPVRVFTSNIDAKDAPLQERDYNYELFRLHGVDIAHTPFIWSLPFKLIFVPRKSIFHVHVAQAIIPEIALVAAKLRRLPYVAHFHMDVGPSGPLGPLFVLYKKIFRGVVLRAADKVIVLSSEQKEFLETEYRVKSENIAIIPNGVGEAFFNRKPRSLSEGGLKLLYVGRLAFQKRPERLIEMMKFLKVPSHLTVIGDGEDRQKLEKLTNDLGLKNISFEGKKYGSELQNYYRNADVFVISSDHEGMPLVILEAMASGLPILGSNVPGTRELINGVGLLANEPYPETFAAALTKLATDPLEFEKLSRQSIEKAEQYSWKKLIEKLEMVYKEVSK